MQRKSLERYGSVTSAVSGSYLFYMK